MILARAILSGKSMPEISGNSCGIGAIETTQPTSSAAAFKRSLHYRWNFNDVFSFHERRCGVQTLTATARL
jgi:hypothetical protein